MPFQPATREKAKLRMCIMGPAKSGKTFTSMRIMDALCGKWAVLDTENGSASKYGGGNPFNFLVDQPANYHPETFIKAIVEAYNAGLEGLIIDSLSHEWSGRGGCLELVDQLTESSKSSNSFAQWGKVTPLHQKVFETINRAPMHIICTLRVKTEYALQPDDRGKLKPVKLGLAPVQRDGSEYEFDILMDMHQGYGYIEHTSRCSYLQNVAIQHPGEQVAQVIKAWLNGDPCPFDLNVTPSAEEKITHVSTPDNKPQPAPPRPNVPVQEAAKAPKLQSSAPEAVAASQSGPIDFSPQKKEPAGSPQTTANGSPGSDATASPASSAQSQAGTTVSVTAELSQPNPFVQGAQAQAPSPANAADGTPPGAPGSNAPSVPVGEDSTTVPASSGNGLPQKIGKVEIAQLLQAASANGWNERSVVSLLESPAFNYTKETIANINVKHWMQIVAIVTHPNNQNGIVTTEPASGKPFPTPVSFVT